MDTPTLNKDAERVARLVRRMYATHHPRMQLKIDLELLKLDILKYIAIVMVIGDSPIAFEGEEDE